MKKITLEDCKNLQKKFDNYTRHAEQHEFVKLAMIDVRIDATIRALEKYPSLIEKQDDLNAMFRVVLKTIGEDYSEYKKEDE